MFSIVIRVDITILNLFLLARFDLVTVFSGFIDRSKYIRKMDEIFVIFRRHLRHIIFCNALFNVD